MPFVRRKKGPGVLWNAGTFLWNGRQNKAQRDNLLKIRAAANKMGILAERET